MSLHAFLLVSLITLTACGKADPRALTDQGSKALSAGRFAEAAKHYEEALAALGEDSTSPDWRRAKIGLFKAQAHVDASLAKTGFLQFASSAPGTVRDDDFSLIASELGAAGKLEEAIAVLEAGKQAFPESVHLDALGKDLVRRAQESGDSGALDSLKGLGYVGD
jgi:tetratricopeptide (TPR) repeat protein